MSDNHAENDTPLLTMEELDRQIEALREKDRALKRERQRIEDQIKAGRPRLHVLVQIKKAWLAGQGISEPESSTSV
jgi:hypothetical protein